MPKTKLSSLEPNDIGLYFNSSMVRVCGLDPEPRWYQFCGFLGPDNTFILKGEKGTKSIEAAVWKKSLSFHSIFPHGFFNFKNTSYYCSRIPVRNVSQGLSKNNYHMESAEEIVNGFGFPKYLSPAAAAHFQQVLLPASRFKTTPANLNLLLEPPQYPKDVKKAFDEVRRGAAFSRAITSTIALFPHPSTKGCLIMFGESPVGECTTPDIIVPLMPEFIQELKDVFSPHALLVKEEMKK